jgi:hypothetical protein
MEVCVGAVHIITEKIGRFIAQQRTFRTLECGTVPLDGGTCFKIVLLRACRILTTNLCG